MPVSGLVVTLRDEPQSRAETLTAISQQSQITMGGIDQNRLAIVVDTASTREDKRLWDWLGSLSGVSQLDVAYVGFEQQSDSTTSDCGTSDCETSDTGQIPSTTPLSPSVDGKEDLHDGR